MNTTTNHIQNAIMRDRLDPLYQLDRGRYGYDTVTSIKSQMMLSMQRTLSEIFLYGVDDDGNILRPDTDHAAPPTE